MVRLRSVHLRPVHPVEHCDETCSLTQRYRSWLFARQQHACNRTLILCGVHQQHASLIHQAEFEEVVGAENICDNVQAPLGRAKQVHNQPEAAAIGLKS